VLHTILHIVSISRIGEISSETMGYMESELLHPFNSKKELWQYMWFNEMLVLGRDRYKIFPKDKYMVVTSYLTLNRINKNMTHINKLYFLFRKSTCKKLRG
jgi:hypothetical protein